MMLAAFLLSENWRKSWRILRRDRKNTESLNAGWTLSAMAGALNIQLEKPSFYKIGDSKDFSSGNIARALRVMLVTAVLFSFTIVFPLLVLKVLVIGAI
jgi:adenosylcobinamide-phosphate synthase